MIKLRIKIPAILLLVIFAGLQAKAQVGELKQNLAIGFNGGVNLNKADFLPKIKQSQFIGFNGGLTARYISEKYFSMLCGVQVELNYTQRGWKELIEDGSGDTYSRNMNYFEIPFMAHLAFGKERRGMRCFLNFGPQVAFLMNEQENKSASWHPETRRVNGQYDKPADKKFDYGITGGGGLEIRTKAGNFLVEGRYYFGLSDFYNTTKKDYFGRAAHATMVGKISYLFDIMR